MNLISTMLGFIGRKIKNLETEVGNINSTLDDVSPAPRVIPIERGGTGATTTNGALDNLFGESPLPISRGGTGVTNLYDAKTNLGIPEVAGVFQLGSNLALSTTDVWHRLNLKVSDEISPNSNYSIEDGSIKFNGTPDETRLIKIDVSVYLTTGFSSGSLVTTRVRLYNPYPSDTFTDTGIRFSTRPTTSNPYIQVIGSGVFKIKSGQSIYLDTKTTTGNGNIGSGIDTRVVVTDYGTSY